MSCLTVVEERPAVDAASLRADLLQVLRAHGLGAADVLNLDVTPLTQSGATVGVTISGMAWSQPTSPAVLAAVPGGAA